MRISGTIVGILMAGALLALLGLTRLLVPSQARVDVDVREIEITTLPEPPPPPPEEPPPEAPPPPPSLTQVSQVPDPTRVAIPKADVPLDISMPVDSFFTDIAPSPLPQPVVRQAPPSPRPTPPTRTTPRPPPAPVAKSHYALGELDGKPRLVRHGSAQFPSSLSRRGVSQGTVVFEVELSESGRVSVRRVISTTHEELVTPARRVASSSSFTSPTRNGQRVKAIMKWPITLRK
jgi:protein TonB